MIEQTIVDRLRQRLLRRLDEIRDRLAHSPAAARCYACQQRIERQDRRVHRRTL